MNTVQIKKDTYAGIMYSIDFNYWYTYLKRRIAKGWSAEELSFLLGRDPFYYTDFEHMHEVEKFLQRERILLDRIYEDSTVEPMTFHRESYELNEERLVRVNIEDEHFYKDYELIIPWGLASKELYMKDGERKTRSCPVPELTFREWKKEESLEELSDATIDIRNKLNRFLDNSGLKEGKTAMELFREVEFTGRHSLKIYPRHLKDGLYNLIKAGKVCVRNMNERYVFFEI